MTTIRALVAVGLLASCGGGGSSSADGAIDAVVFDSSGGGGADARIDAVPADAMLTTASEWTATDGLPEAACVPWTLTDTADPENPVLAEGMLTLADDADSEALFYSHGPTVLAMPAALVIEARLSFGTGASQSDSRSGAGFGFTLDDDRKNSVFIEDGAVFLLTAESTRGPTYVGATDDAPHTYRLEADTTSGAIEVFRDDVSILTGTTFVSPYPVEAGIWWGEASIVARGSAAWTSVSHNALVPIACP